MESRAKFLGHSVHQMLVVFPLGLLATAVIFDLAYLLTGNMDMAGVSYWLLAAGLIGVAAAAPFGVIDFLAIPHNTRAKHVATLHGVGNLVVALLFAGSWLLRYGASDTPDLAVAPTATALALSFAGAALALVTAWLGGELVARLGVGVSDGAGLNATSSLARRPDARSAPRHG